MRTTKKCLSCGNCLDYKEEQKGRELTCNKCKRTYEYRAYMSAISGERSMWALTAREQNKMNGMEEQVKNDSLCKKCGKPGKLWGGLHKECRAEIKKNLKPGALAAVGGGRVDPGERTGIVGPDGVVIPVRLEITVSLKIETH